MESWNIYSQNAPSTPSSAWLCPQNNTPGPEWLHSQNNSNERERNENTAALATPTRYIMEYNDVNQNSTSGSFYNPYAQEMERLFDNNFLKIGNPEDLLNSNDMYNNENLSWLNSNENIIPVTAASNISNIMTTTTTTAPSNIPTTTNVANSPTPSLVTDDDQDQLYNNNEVPTTTTASFIQYPITANTTNTSTKSSSSSTSPISPRVVKSITAAATTAANFYQPNLRQDQYVQSKKHDPKQLLLPLSTNTNSIDGTMTVSMTSPTSSLFTDDDLDSCDQTKTKVRRQSYYQDFPLSISTNDLPMQQPSPASSEFSSGVKTPPPCNETTPKQKKRKVSQRKLNNNRRTSKVEGSLISPVDESYLEQNEQTSANISDDLSDTEETCSITKDTSVSSIDSNSSDSSTKRELPDDGHDETPEEKRARLLERNRIAAAKCRQKKKQAQECLQQQASDLTQKNTTMHTLVNDLREEALKLKNQLLAHSTCNCNVIQEYVRTSGQFAFARPPYTK